MTPEVELALITASSALGGSIVGGLVTYLTTRHLKTQEWRLEQLDKELSKREQLYADFLAECGRLAFKVIDSPLNEVAEFTKLYALRSRIELISSEGVTKSAFAAVFGVADIVRRRDKKDFKLTSDGKPEWSDLSRQFANACRAELEKLARRD